MTAVSVVVFSTLAGFAFAKLRFRGRKGLLVFVIATMAVPTQLGIVPLFIVMSKLGWTGTLFAVIVPGMVTAFGVFWMTQYLQDALPYELIEAARVDGASMIRPSGTSPFPAARPAAAMLALFTFVATWTNFFWPFIVLGPTNPTLPVALQLLQAALLHGLLGGHGRRRPGHDPAAAAVRRRRPPPRVRNHARGSQGMNTTPSTIPRGLSVGGGHGCLPDRRGRPRRTAGRTQSGTRSAGSPVRVADGHNGDVACDHYHR